MTTQTAASPPSGALARLIADLHDIYKRCGTEVRYVDEHGIERAYWPKRYHTSLLKAEAAGEVVPFVERLCLRATGSWGFHTLQNFKRADLSVEALVVDETKPYHDLFSRESVESARIHLEGMAPPAAPVALVPGSTFTIQVTVEGDGRLTATLV